MLGLEYIYANFYYIYRAVRVINENQKEMSICLRHVT